MDSAGVTPVIEIERTRLNLWNVGGLVAVVVVNVFGLGVLYNSQTNANEIAKANNLKSEKDIESLRLSITEIKALMPPMQYSIETVTRQAAENKASIAATNERTDRIVSSFSDRFDEVISSVNTLVTRVEVIASRLDIPPAQRRASNTPQRGQ